MDPNKEHHSRSPMVMMLILLAIFFGVIFLYKIVMGYFIGQYMEKAGLQPVTVSEIKAEYQEWQPTLRAAASARAVKGVDVTTEVAGIVNKIYFVPGAEVEANDLLLELTTDAEKAQLASLEASMALAQITYDRDKKLYETKTVSKSILDTDIANLKSSEAQVEQQKAIIAKKNIHAPFAGRLGISAVNPGLYLNPGDKIVTLQSLNPIFIDFLVPQQNMNKLEVGRNVELTTDVYPGRKFFGKITTITPKVDPKTRNIEVEATFDNADHALLPGMFGNVVVNIEKPVQYITLPQTAVTYNPYGDIVYLIKEDNQEKENQKEKGKEKDKSRLIVQQTFVTVGEKRGDQVAITSGLKPGDRVVTTGQMKLKNGSVVVINNKIEPSFSPKLDLPEEQ